MGRQTRGMDDLADKAEQETNEALRDTELKLLLETRIDWNALRPQIADQETYDTLIAAVQSATAQNESIAQLKARIVALGSAGIAVAGKVVQLIGRV